MDKSVTLSLLLMGSLIMLVPFPNMNIFSNAMAIEEDSDKGNNGDNNSPRYEEEDSDKGNNGDNNSPRYEEEDSDKGNNGDNNSPRYEEEDSDKGNNGDNNSPRYEEEDSDKGNNGDNNNLPAYEQDYSDKGSYATRSPHYGRGLAVGVGLTGVALAAQGLLCEGIGRALQLKESVLADARAGLLGSMGAAVVLALLVGAGRAIYEAVRSQTAVARDPLSLR